MNVYYITPRISETGEKFKLIEEKKSKIFNQTKKLAYEIGFKGWYGSAIKIAGPPTILVFKNHPDKKIFKKVKDGFFPKKTSEKGRQIIEKLDKIESIYRRDLNMCVNYEEYFFEHIGYAFSNSDYYGFIVDSDWKFTPPTDCEEVTYSKYNELFASTKKRSDEKKSCE